MSDDARSRNPMLAKLRKQDRAIRALAICYRDVSRRVRRLESRTDDHEARIVDLIVGLPTKKPRR